MGKILITGNCGFIGSRLEKKLNGTNMVTVDKKNGVDVLDNLHMFDIDLIYHLAGQTSVNDSFKDLYQDAMDNIMTMVNLLQIHPHTKIIYTNTAASLDVQSPYGLSKKVAEEYLMRFHKGPKVSCVLPNIFGEGSKGVIERLIQDNPINIFGNGEQTREFIHVDDVVRGLIMARHWNDGVYRLGTGRPYSVIELAKFTGKRIIHHPSRSAEVIHSRVGNTTPNWYPIASPENYIKSKLGQGG